LYSKQKFICYL